MSIRKFNIRVILAMAIILASSSLRVSAANVVSDNFVSADFVTLLNRKSIDTEYNIMLYDEDGRILNEFHTDGEVISFSYQKDTLCEVNNSNGNNAEIMLQNGIITVTRYSNQQQIDVINIARDAARSISSKDERTALLEMAANGRLGVEANVTEPNNVLADTISSGYNLSAMCPSIWTVAMGNDRFARPSTAMNKDEIQDFLEDKNSVLANDILVYRKNSEGVVYSTGITINPATVIDNASRTYAINPKIILASLQREQGLITKTSGDVSARAFYFCMGYGATDSGDMNGYTGFDTQVDQGTNRYAELWYEAYYLGQKGLPVEFAASDGTLQINNCGTYALFRYTPWQSSNLLFLQVMKGYWPDSSGINGINWE